MYTDYEEDNEKYYSDDDNKSQNSEKIKKIAIFILIFVIVIVLILILAKGCAKKNNNTNNDNTTSTNVRQQNPTIMIGRETLSLNVGEEFELQADVLNTKNANPAIKWRSDDTSVASVNDEGFIKAEGKGVTAIIASYKENNKTYTNACVVTVTENVVKLEGIKLSQKNVNLKKGAYFLIEVTTIPTDAKVDKFIYESSDTNVAVVDEKGRVSAKELGTATITVKTEDNSVSETVTVNVVDIKSNVTVIEPTGIEIVGFTNGLTVGKTTQAVMNITPNSATNKTVKWSSSNEKIAKVDSNGVVTGVSAGTCTIMVATSNNITASKEITVSPNTISVDKVSIVGSTSITMKVGGTRYLYYTISPNNASNKKVAYKSSNPSVVYVDSNGILAAVGVGTAAITITTQDGGKTAVANVTVVASNASGTSSSSSTSSTSSNNSTSTNTSDTTTSNNTDTSTNNYSNYNYQTDSSTYSTTYNYSDDSSTNSCNSYDMLTIKHNESKDIYSDIYAVVSTISFDNAKPFTRSGLTPTLELTQFNSECIKFLNYTIYYGTTKDNVNTKYRSGKILKLGDKIVLDDKNGYYRIEITGQTRTDSTYLKKTYYAYVEKTHSVTDYMTIKQTYSNSKRTFTMTKNDSKLKRVYYCVSSGSNCSPSVAQKGLTNSKKVYYGYINMTKDSFPKSMTKGAYNQTPSLSKGYKICFAPYNGNIIISKQTVCYYI